MSTRFGGVCQEEVVIALRETHKRIDFEVSLNAPDADGQMHLGGKSPLPADFWEKVRQFAALVPHDCVESAWGLKPQAERDAVIAKMAANGRKLFHQLLPDKDEREKFRALIAPTSGPAPRIRARSSAAGVPWEALCLAEPDTALTYKDFLGWSNVVVREGHGLKRTGPRPVETIAAMNAVEDDGLTAVLCGRTTEAREQFGDRIDHEVLDKLTGPEDLPLFYDFLFDQERAPGVIHFDCHVEVPSEQGLFQTAPIEGSSLRVTEDFHIEWDRFAAPDLDVAFSPLVFLNCCNAGTLSIGGPESYAGRFREAGARSIIASEAKVADAFAVDFAETFYQIAGTCENVGAALLRTRQFFLVYDRNPLSLFYGLYGNADDRLGLPRADPPKPDSALGLRLEALIDG